MLYNDEVTVIHKASKQRKPEINRLYYYWSWTFDKNKLAKDEKRVCIILPDEAKVSLYNTGSTVISGLTEGSLGFGAWTTINDLPNHPGKKAIFFDVSGCVLLCMWDEVFQKAFVKYVRYETGIDGIPDISKLFTGITVAKAVLETGEPCTVRQVLKPGKPPEEYIANFEPAVGILGDKLVKVRRVGERFFVLNKNPDGPIFAENENDAVEFEVKESYKKQIIEAINR